MHFFTLFDQNAKLLVSDELVDHRLDADQAGHELALGPGDAHQEDDGDEHFA